MTFCRKALVHIAYAYAGGGQISNGRNSKTVTDTPINMVHFTY